MPRRPSRGRQIIPIRRIENQEDLYATFSKRRHGLYKKASELITLCDADVGLFIFSPTNNPYSFCHPSMDSVLERYRNPNQLQDDHARVIDAEARGMAVHLNTRLDALLDEIDILKEKDKQADELYQTRGKGWWEEIDVESLNKEQVKEWNERFQSISSNVKKFIDDTKKVSSISSTAQHQNVAYSHGVAGPSAIPHDLPGQSYAPNIGMIMPSQSPLHYFNNPPELPYFVGGTSHVLNQYYGPSETQYPLSGGGHDLFQQTDIINNVSLQGQDPFNNSTGQSYAHGEIRDSHTSLEVGPSNLGNFGEPSTSRGAGEPSTHNGYVEARPSYQGDNNP